MREFHADGVSVGENKAEPGQVVNAGITAEVKTMPVDKRKSFSSFPHAHQDEKNAEKGLWEKIEPRSREN